MMRKKWIKPVLGFRKQILCAASGLAAGLAAQILQKRTEGLTDLKRPDPGREEQQQLLVKGLDQGEISVSVQVAPKQYTREEAKKLYDQVWEEIPGRILGDNPSLSQVEHDLNLIREIPEYGLNLEWESSRPELLGDDGEVSQPGPEGEKEMVWLYLRMTDGQTQEVYPLSIWILPKKMTPQEEERIQFEARLADENYAQRYSPVLELPEEFYGKALSYRKAEEPVFPSIAFLGVAGALLLTVKERSDRQRAIRERKNQLQLDYPELLSKMMIFLGAGMTVRNACEQMSEDYLRLRKLGKREIRWVYEELGEACSQMRRGIPEGQAYLEFGKRCGLPCYTKFAGFLEQSRKNGAKNLRDHLRLEMEEAYEQRKQQAKRLGEEASTKLLLPLFLMLGVVMVMVAVPAMLEFM